MSVVAKLQSRMHLNTYTIWEEYGVLRFKAPSDAKLITAEICVCVRVCAPQQSGMFKSLTQVNVVRIFHPVSVLMQRIRNYCAIPTPTIICNVQCVSAINWCMLKRAMLSPHAPSPPHTRASRSHHMAPLYTNPLHKQSNSEIALMRYSHLYCNP